MSDNDDEVALIACEPCRRKKCKCDRKLPHCLQCRSAPASCQYPEKIKRGIPAGYVTAMDRRLAETERALFHALAEIHKGTVSQADYDSQTTYQGLALPVLSPPAATTATTQQDKMNLVNSWARYPLKNRAQAEMWFQSMLRGPQQVAGSPPQIISRGSPEPAVHSAATFRSDAQITAWDRHERPRRQQPGTFGEHDYDVQRRSSQSAGPGSAQPGHALQSPEASSCSRPENGESKEIANVGVNIIRNSKASRFAIENQKLYF